MRSLALRGLILFAVAWAGGCATTREITVSTKPDDANLAIDGQDQGRGPITRKFVFKSDQDGHDVTASRVGYKDQTVHLMRSYDAKDLLIELHPQTKRVTFNVTPVPGIVKVDGRPLSPEPTSQASVELEFTADAGGKWTSHTVTAERPDWSPSEQKINWADPSPQYTLVLGPVHKDLSITTNPPGAQVMLNNQSIGKSPVKLKDVPFPVDPATGQFLPQRLTLTKPGYDPYVATINWDGGKGDYRVDLPPKAKTVHIISTPPGATITINGQVLQRANDGSSTGRLVFVPTDDDGTLPVFKAIATKKTADVEWYPKEIEIPWDQGRSDYSVALKEIRTTPVALIDPTPVRTDDGWRIVPKTVSTLGMKDVTEPGDGEQPTRVTELQKGTVIGSTAISPDGSQLLFTILSTPSSGELRSRIEMIKSDGSGGSTVFEEQALSLTPSFTPDGTQILFVSNRAGKRLSVWQASAVGEAGITQLTMGEENTLWPVVDSEPKPRLFYEALVDSLPNARLYMTRVGTTTRTDLARGGGMQPRVNPKGDRILCCNTSEKTGKRQICIISDHGGPAIVLGDPEADEYDAVWSKDGGKIAFASNRGKDDETGNNYDIWVIDLAHPDHAIQVTKNGSWDDRPQWDPSGKFLYFRSNRGGQWAIWKIAVPPAGMEGSAGAHAR